MEKNNIGRYFSQMYRKGRIFYSNKLEKYGLGSGQSIFLFQLYKKDGISQEELSNILYVDKATTTRAIQKLEKQGFVKRITSDRDRRSNIVYLTDKAKELQKDIENILKEWDTILLKSLTSDEKEKLLEILKKMENNYFLK